MTLAICILAAFVVIICRDVAVRWLADRADARVHRTTEAERASAKATADVADLTKRVRELEGRTMAALDKRVRR